MADTWVEAACGDCGKVKQVRWNSELNQGRCRACRARAAPKEPCGECGREMRVNARRADGAALCVTCYARTRTRADRCDGCGAVGPLAVRADGKGGHPQDLCARCYRNPERPCGVCGRSRRVALKATADSPDICPTCYQAPMIDCSVCGQRGLGRRATKNGKPWCFACQATDRIDTLLAAPDGTIPVSLKDVRDALVSTSRPRSILSNWDRITSLSLLARLVSQHAELTHELLDAEGNRFSVTYLRALLVTTGVLPERDEQAARLDQWATTLLAGIEPAQHRQLLTRYARWHVIARGRPDRHGQLRPTVADRCRQEIRAAQRFLAHLIERGTDLEHCRQSDIDDWLADRHGMKLRFLSWLQANGELADMTLPVAPPPTGPGDRIDQDEQWATVRRMLHDPTAASIEDRAAACLVLLYAQRVSKIVALTVDDITVTGRGTFMKLGPEPVLLLPLVADLVTQLPIAKPFGAARTLADAKWLLPGKRAGHHQHPKSLIDHRRSTRPGSRTKWCWSPGLPCQSIRAPSSQLSTSMSLGTVSSTKSPV